MYYQYKLNLIPRIISIRQISFHVFRDCGKKNSNIRNETFLFIAFKGTILLKIYWRLTNRPIPDQETLLKYSSITKKFHSPYSDNTLNDLRIQISRRIWIYIRKYTRVEIRGPEACFLWEKKNRSPKSCASVPLRCPD